MRGSLCKRGHIRVAVDQIPVHSRTRQAHGIAVTADSEYKAEVADLELQVEVDHKAETVTLPEELEHLVRRTTVLTKRRGRAVIPRVQHRLGQVPVLKSRGNPCATILHGTTWVTQPTTHFCRYGLRGW